MAELLVLVLVLVNMKAQILFYWVFLNCGEPTGIPNEQGYQ
jgi:hypothetical protein